MKSGFSTSSEFINSTWIFVKHFVFRLADESLATLSRHVTQKFWSRSHVIQSPQSCPVVRCRIWFRVGQKVILSPGVRLVTFPSGYPDGNLSRQQQRLNSQCFQCNVSCSSGSFSRVVAQLRATQKCHDEAVSPQAYQAWFATFGRSYFVSVSLVACVQFLSCRLRLVRLSSKAWCRYMIFGVLKQSTSDARSMRL